MNPPLRKLARSTALALLALTVSAVSQADPGFETATWRGQDVVSGEVLVQFTDTTTQQAQDEVHERLGGVRLTTLTSQLGVVRAPTAVPLDLTLERYAADPAVAFAYPNTIHRALEPAVTPTDDPMLASQWGLVSVRAFEAWTIESGSSDVVIAIIDSGLDRDHPDLADHYAWGLDTYGADTDPDDYDGHGTHCAGIAAAVTGNATGVAGIARDCRVAGYRCGNSSFPSSTLIAAIHDARTRGAHVLSMSWGSYGSNPAIRSALDDALADGCVLVAAAGNDGTQQKLYPAALDTVIAVGATKQGDVRASFSNHGSWVSVAAPGQQITSTYKNGLYATLSGTSMATPLVAGAAALVYSRLGGVRSPSNAAAVRAALEDSAVDIGGWLAHGRIDVVAALGEVDPPGQSDIVPVIASVSPPSWPALGGTHVTLTGTGFLGVDTITVGGASVLASSQGVVSDTEYVFTTSDASALGSTAIVLAKGPLTSAPFAGTVTETTPPRLEIPSAIATGVGFEWRMGGAVDSPALLIMSLGSDTFMYRGFPVLIQMTVLWSDQLDGTGLATLGAICPPGFNGLTFHSQLATIDHGSFGASTVRTTTINQ